MLCIVAMMRYWDESTALIRGTSLWNLAALLLLLLTVWGLAVKSWQLIVLAFSARPLATESAARHLAYLVLGKYVPGGVWGFLARFADSSAQRPAASMLAAGVAEQWMNLIAISLLSSIAVLAGSQRQWTWLLLCVLVPAISVVSLAMLHRLMRGGYRLLPMRWRIVDSAPPISPRSRTLWLATVLSCTHQSLILLVVAWIAGPAFSLEPGVAAAIAGSYGLAVALGIAAIVVPGGILVREAFFVAFVSTWLSTGEAVALAAMLRLTFTGFDLLTGVLAGGMRLRGGKVDA